MSERPDPRGTVAIAELADELRCYKSTLFKIAKRLDIQPQKVRDTSRGNQRVSVVERADATRIRTAYLETSKTTDQAFGDGSSLGAEEGFFYLIQLEPHYDPGRFNAGFTTDLEGRLRHHRCAAPFAEYIKSWPCHRTWERAAMDCLTAGIEQLHTEVFRTESLDEMRDRGDRFFGMMPPVRLVAEADDDEAIPRKQDPD
jgi:hypothetical protein